VTLNNQSSEHIGATSKGFTNDQKQLIYQPGMKQLQGFINNLQIDNKPVKKEAKLAGKHLTSYKIHTVHESLQ
jgi:hypothetical protein